MFHIAARTVAVAALSVLLAGSPLMAQTATTSVPSAPAATDKAKNSGELICEKQEATGSRLTKRRVCMTRAQWADLKLQDRQEIERAQVRRGTSGQ